MEKLRTGTAYVHDKKGKKIKTIIINGEDPKNATKAGLIGTIVEEGSHVIGKVEGRQRNTGTDEKGLESTGRASNEYFSEKYKDDIQLSVFIRMGRIIPMLILGKMWGIKQLFHQNIIIVKILKQIRKKIM
ncbi:hypothetical protein HMPREF1984_02112 [Leptotrichia sp. oral taxon 215 str. W9775]|uniref:hypothetical protein n=1 Tax=Leptotrichia sp. oral taxon 215 TaxID=712359 RepID=UPI0003AE42CC|nr:hypothetical protein [Leptotrichia sp. oral taxon 215]ERK65738.1 hypothetical protein HMPREF1984_02112 [Leptotrichia sp. oral taxon 215 str. W9775]